jgi:hypothetical protein
VSKYRYILIKGTICLIILCLDLASQRAYALVGSTAQGGSNAQAVHALGETGENVNVGLIAARNVLATHEAFYDKDANGNPIGSTHAFNYDFSGSGIAPVNHDTWMAGIVASRGGILHPDDIGVAPGAYLHCARVGDNSDNLDFSWLNNALDELIIGQNCKAIVTGFSFGTLITPDGQSDWTLLYDYYAYHYNVIFANAAGNNNTQIAVFGDAYNGITTGGLDVPQDDEYNRVGILSGSGTTSDGRRKPDIVAPAQNQTMPTTPANNSWYTWTSSGGHTSLSGPHTAGLVALLSGLADDTSDPCDSQNEVIRAVIVNSTFPNIDDKSGSSTNPADPNNLWNEDRGYGRIDALRAYTLLDSNRVFSDVTITEEKGWAFSAIIPSQQHTYIIQAPKRHRLVATLAWDRRVEWTDKPPKNGIIDPGELNPYLADLDLRIYEPNAVNPIFSKQAFGFDPNDNLIRCDILLTSSGRYTIKVVNNSTGETVRYGLAFELLPPLPCDFDLDYIVDYSDLRLITESWLQSAPGSDADLFQDSFIDFRDFALFAENWLTSDPAYH